MYDYRIVGNALVVEKCDKGRYTFEEVKVKLLDYLSGKYIMAAEADTPDKLMMMYW